MIVADLTNTIKEGAQQEQEPDPEKLNRLREYINPANVVPTLSHVTELEATGLTHEEMANYACVESGLPRYTTPRSHPSAEVINFISEQKAIHPLGPIDACPWLPIGMLGPIPLLGHFHPYARDTFGFHRDLVFYTILTGRQYIEAFNYLNSSLSADVKTRQTFEISNIDAKTPEALLQLLDKEQWLPSEYAGKLFTAISAQDRWVIEMLHGKKRVVAFNALQLNDSTLGALPQAMMEKYQMVCYAREQNVYYIASSNPNTNRNRLAGELNARMGTLANNAIEVVCGVAHSSFIQNAIQTLMTGNLSSTQDASAVIGAQSGGTKETPALLRIENIQNYTRPMTPDMETPEVFRWIMYRAISTRTSDIHIQEGAEAGEVRFRMNGELQPIVSLSLDLTRKVMSVIKITSEVNVAEKRLPQDGRFSIEMPDASCDARVSTVPIQTGQAGESCVIRLINKQSGLKTLSELEIPTHNMNVIKWILSRESGLGLVTGPTGSGKTSTLYAFLNEINSPETAIITIEDPVEITLPRAKQLQVNNTIQLTFAKLLRAVLRHDPDVILVGEIRDKETAENAIQAAQTGHLVFSTLHTNDALRAITRMAALGIDRDQLANALLMVQAQRLVRTLCPECRKPRAVTDEERATLRANIPEPSKDALPGVGFDPSWYEVMNETVAGHAPVYDSGTCMRCNQTGFTKRRAMMEVFNIDEGARDLIENGAKVGALSQYYRKLGYADLPLESLRTFLNGETSYEEIKGFLR